MSTSDVASVPHRCTEIVLLSIFFFARSRNLFRIRQNDPVSLRTKSDGGGTRKRLSLIYSSSCVKCGGCNLCLISWFAGTIWARQVTATTPSSRTTANGKCIESEKCELFRSKIASPYSFNQSNESKQRHFTTIELSDSKKKSTNEKDDYDPYVSREVEHPTS